MSDVEIRIDPSDGEPYTWPEVLNWLRNRGWSVAQIQQHWSESMKLWEKPVLRFSQGDRVMCNVGPRRLAGTILSLDTPDPQDPDDPRENLPYVIKTDPITGVEPSRTISAPSDIDNVICRERCFHSKSEADFAKWAAPIAVDKTKKLRFGVGDAVAIRVKDNNDGCEQWVDGKITEVWPALPGPPADGFLKVAEAVPYMVSFLANENQKFYCHRDEHTLIRKPENKPRKLTKTISKRFEIRQRDDGKLEQFDHVTLRGKIVDDLMSDSE